MRYRNSIPIVLFAALVLTSGGCSKKAKDIEPSQMPITWRKVTLTVAGKKHVVDVGRYEHAIGVKPVDATAAKRDNPIDTWNAWQSLSIDGQTDKDLKAYSEFYTDPAAFFKRQKYPERFFDDNRKADEQPQALGLIKYGTYQAVVYSVRRQTQYRAAVMVQKNGRFSIDEGAKLTNPVLRELAAEGYKIIKEPTTTATAPAR